MRSGCRAASHALVVSIVAVAACWGQGDRWASPPFADPLRFSSLPVDGMQAAAPASGEWQLANAVSYFNVWQLTWHTATIHEGFGLVGQPLTAREIAILEQNFPADQFYHVDLEGWRDDFYATVGLGRGVAVTLQVPWVEIGSPHWDVIAENFHAWLGLAQFKREVFPRGQSTVYVRGRSGAIERLSGLAEAGIGDVSLAVTGPLGRFLGADERWVVALKAPTGERNSLRGSGGWDAGLRWFGTWGSRATQVRLGLGYTWLDRNGSWLGAQRDNTWGALVEAHTPLSRTLTLRGSARYDSSPLRSFTASDMGKPSFFWTVGVLASVADNGWVAFDLGENYPSRGEVPDFSLQLQIGIRLPCAR
jgi:hypothetical protein